MIKYNCTEQSQMLQWFETKQNKTKKVVFFFTGKKNRSCEEKGEFLKKAKVIKAGATPSRVGLVFTCTR